MHDHYIIENFLSLLLCRKMVIHWRKIEWCCCCKTC